jgi:predicted nucleic acid-binding protein
MGIKYLWDTNTAIYFLQKQFPLPAEKFIDNLLKETQAAISAITEIELLCWKTSSPNDLTVIHDFINDTLVLN